MKGAISLGDFIHEVKDELVRAQKAGGTPFYELTEVLLEVSFTLDTSGKAGLKLVVAELEGGAKAEQMHKVTLKLIPVVGVDKKENSAPSGSGSSGIRYIIEPDDKRF